MANDAQPVVCPVDHSSSEWKNLSLPADHPPVSSTSTSLPQHREVSSIPRTDGTNWVYPSQAQFYAAMARKQHDPRASDMPVLVPIHNAVNERAWSEVMTWERGKGAEKCGGVKLVSFKGRPKERSLRARWNMMLGYQAPFDRHDWIIDRCGIKQRYIIDFYTGKNATRISSPGNGTPNLAFFLDVRPAIDNWDGLQLRISKFFESFFVGRGEVKQR